MQHRRQAASSIPWYGVVNPSLGRRGQCSLIPWRGLINPRLCSYGQYSLCSEDQNGNEHLGLTLGPVASWLAGESVDDG